MNKYLYTIIAFLMMVQAAQAHTLTMDVCCNGAVQTVEISDSKPMFTELPPSCFESSGGKWTYYCGYRKRSVIVYGEGCGYGSIVIVERWDDGECSNNCNDSDGDGYTEGPVPFCPNNDMCPGTPSGEQVDGHGCSCKQLDNCPTGNQYFTTRTAWGPDGKVMYKEIMVADAEGNFLRYEEWGDPQYYNDCMNGLLTDCTADNMTSPDPFGPNNQENVKDYDTQLKQELETNPDGNYPDIYDELGGNPNYDGPPIYNPNQVPPPNEQATLTPEPDNTDPNAHDQAIIENQGKQLRAQQQANGYLADIKKGVDALNKKNMAPNVTVNAPGYDGPTADDIASANKAKTEELLNSMEADAQQALNDIDNLDVKQYTDQFAGALSADEIAEHEFVVENEGWFQELSNGMIDGVMSQLQVDVGTVQCSINADCGRFGTVDLSFCQWSEEIDTFGSIFLPLSMLGSILMVFGGRRD